MTNDQLSQPALDSIAVEIEEEEISTVHVTCTYSGESAADESEFDVWDGDNYIFSVSNDGTVYHK